MKGFLKDVLDGKVREVRKWLEKGENVSQYDEYGNTALHLAAEKGYRGVCKVLLDAGADVNQKNISVGWSAIHYAAYEGHSDVLRMLIAHGAVPDIPDKSGDTPESYAAEWENMECVAILREATAARRAAGRDMSEMYDSDERTASEDSDDDDDDESSMMNWIMPPPSVPKNVTNNVNVSVNNSSDSSVHLSVHMEPPGGQQRQMNRSDNNGNIIENESLPDLTDQTLTGTLRDDDSDTYSEDTLQLMQQTNAMKSNKDGSVRGGGASSGMSIVDKIKNNLASQSSEVNSTNREKAKICSGVDPLLSGRSHLEQTSLSQFSMSSATIPDDLTMSTTSVFDKLTNSLDGEKEALLRRLRELMLTEENQVDKNLNDCKARLSMMESEYLTVINQLKEEVMKEEEALMQKQLDEVNSLKKSQRAEEDRIEMEIRKLEAEFESILAPSKMVASLRDSSSQSDQIPRGVNTNAELSELELELQCSGCMKVCCPPSMIFQCPEGDLLCQDCRDTVDVCPACNIALCAGLLSRNKVLENIARKYFKCM